MWPEEEADIRSWDCTSASQREVDMKDELGYKEEERQTSKTKKIRRSWEGRIVEGNILCINKKGTQIRKA